MSNIDRKHMTVVFNVPEGANLDELYNAFRTDGMLLNMKPTLLSWGDQVRVPSEIMDALFDMDPDLIDTQQIRELISTAREHRFNS